MALWVGLCTAGAARYRDFRGYACVLAGYTATLIGIPATSAPGRRLHGGAVAGPGNQPGDPLLRGGQRDVPAADQQRGAAQHTVRALRRVRRVRPRQPAGRARRARALRKRAQRGLRRPGGGPGNAAQRRVLSKIRTCACAAAG
ncbi:FUSC family protein [Pseudomonas aeruginosa]